MEHELEATGDASPKAGPIAGRGTSVVDPELHRTLLDVLRAVASHRDLPSLLRELFDVLRRMVPFARVALVLHDPGRDVMRLLTLAGQPLGPDVLELPVAESPAGVAWQTQRPLVLENIDRETRFSAATEIMRADGIKSLCNIPLTSPLRRLGTLSFGSRDDHAFSDADVDFLQQLTSQIALAVDNTLHHEQLASERDRLQLLLEVNNALVSNLDRRTLFGEIASCLRRVVPHDYTSVAVYDAERGGFDMRALEFAGKGLIKENMFVPVEGSPAGLAFTAREPRRFERTDLAMLRSEIAGLLLAEGIQAMCSVPLAVRDRRLGALCIGRLGGEPFSVADAELLAAVAKQVAFPVDNALAFQEIAELKDKLAAEKVYLEDEIRTEYDFEEIIGQSSALKRVLHQVETVAPTDAAVLIGGETGTGKELIARAIHQLSQRRERTFVKLNCAAIPTGLLESELFGHERGAFTGAIAQRVGRFELADRGTLFLDEVGDIPPELQPKLLRVLQEKEFERLGSTRTRQVDVRVIAATNRNLEEMVAAGTFRRDLYYRLNVFPVTIPPLRERPEDIAPLVHHFVQKFARRMNKRIETVSADGMAALSRYAWPGNVRELENAIERAAILTNGPVLRVPASEFRARVIASPGDETLEVTEREAILRALHATNWVLGGPNGAAARLGLKRTTLQARMRKLGIRRGLP
ncbi:MAG: GAF domain-containing protein [Deltaproteobacteria bacterium]|nr:MAG: GAF domain-containing protein [Deltaproteobacteria bacterium]